MNFENYYLLFREIKANLLKNCHKLLQRVWNWQTDEPWRISGEKSNFSIFIFLYTGSEFHVLSSNYKHRRMNWTSGIVGRIEAIARVYNKRRADERSGWDMKTSVFEL